MGRKKSSPNTPKKEDSPVKKVGKGAGADSKSFSGKPKGRDTLQRVPDKAKENKRSAEGQQLRNESFPIVGIGASAGGLEAFTYLLDHLPGDTGMAFVLIQHLDPRHESMLPELLSRATRMPVTQVEDGMSVEPNHIYVIPSNANMGISDGILSLIVRPKTSTPPIPIDNFLRSLAVDQKDKSIGVILSGTGSDGAIGIEAIKAEGGITFAQDEKSAKYNGMPRSAIATGCVDFILPPEEIAKELARIGSHPYVTRPLEAQHIVSLRAESEDDFNKIFILVRTATGVDFSHYKRTTVRRRIMRRMALHRIERLNDYVDYLKNNPSEVEALYQDILIKVTGFFREPETFDFLKKKIFPEIVKNKSSEEPIRVWVPGCSTGEEVYSIAICLLEFLGNRAASTQIQIFATDISDIAIGKARTGIYIENIVADVSAERLRRFFVKTEFGYQIIKSIRDMCIFAKQNLIKDPPFSNLDLISCRNVLIYLGPNLQKKMMPIFHYALKPSGFLMLGNAETIGTFSDLFAPTDKKHKVYSKKAVLSRLVFNFVKEPVEKKPAKKMDEEVGSELDMYKRADHIVLSRYAPPGVVINSDMEVLQFRGHTSPYLEPAPGRASLNLLKMAREGLLLDLRSAIQEAKKTGAPVRKEGLRVKYEGQFRDANIEVIPIMGPSAREHHFLVLFEDATRPVGPRPKKTIKKVNQKIEAREVIQLKQELEATKEYLQSVIQEYEASNEELKSANEEIQSSNEELQSINEELETAKEELQSTNEELTTVNEELQNRNLELSQANNDLNNLLTSVNIPIVMVENDLRIRRFTPMAEKVLNLIPQDIGRSISDIRLNIDVLDLDKLISDAIDTISLKEQEVQSRNGCWYYMQIRPYRTSENKIDGAVMTLFDINERKRKEDVLRRLATVVRDSNDAITVLGFDGQILAWNRGAEKLYGYTEAEALKMNIRNIIPETKQEEEQVFFQRLSWEESLELFETQHVTKDGRILDVWLTATALTDDTGRPIAIAMTERDITKRKQVEEELQRLIRQNELILNSAGEGIFGIELEGNITFANPAAAGMLGREVEELISKRVHDIIHHSKPNGTPYPQDECPIYVSLKDGTIHRIADEVFWRKDGTSFAVEYISTPIQNERGELVGAVVIFKDITERKRVEEMIRKEILLKEIHHRVKNNLQVISGLLNIQSGHIQDRQAIEMFKECQNRIRSMALIHEQLYQSKDLKRINFNEYIQNLAVYLFRSYGIDLNTITLQIRGDDVSFDIDTAVPCGLIINELVSNSLKYAFPEGKKGEIRVDISSDGDNRYTLTVGDNGVGFPEGLDFRNTESLGLQLVMMLVGQIGGIIEHDKSNGTEFKVTFEELKK